MVEPDRISITAGTPVGEGVGYRITVDIGNRLMLWATQESRLARDLIDEIENHAFSTEHRLLCALLLLRIAGSPVKG